MIKVKKILWESKNKDNGMGYKYRLIQDDTNWIRIQVKVLKNSWMTLDYYIYEQGHVQNDIEILTDVSEFLNMVGGFEEAIGREIFKAKNH
jgi:hypothetical protein